VQNVQGRPNKGQGMNPWGGNAAGYGEAQNRAGNVNQGQARPDEAPTAQTMFMANLSSADLITDKARSSYDSDILSEVQDHDQYLDDTYHTSISNMIPYDQEQVELYERRANFELTEHEQEINEQLRLVILDRNLKEETLKQKLHSTKLQLTSTINRNKSMVEETTFLKQNFKQKENKLLADFLNMKSLKEKVED
nr:hypothetical protein [Tanacetum cinerariifolium]